MAEYYSIIYMYHNFWFRLSASGNLGCFHVLVTVNSAAVNPGVHVSVWITVFSGYKPSNGIAGSYGSFKKMSLSAVQRRSLYKARGRRFRCGWYVTGLHTREMCGDRGSGVGRRGPALRGAWRQGQQSLQRPCGGMTPAGIRRRKVGPWWCLVGQSRGTRGHCSLYGHTGTIISGS